MKLNKEPRELGDWYEVDAGWGFYIAVFAVIVGLVILVAEWSGLADAFISSFE
jgi:hypothetical protein